MEYSLPCFNDELLDCAGWIVVRAFCGLWLTCWTICALFVVAYPGTAAAVTGGCPVTVATACAAAALLCAEAYAAAL